MIPVPKRSFPEDHSHHDLVACEHALIIDVVYGKPHHRKLARLATTMRSPGHDHELAVGLMYSLGIIEAAVDMVAFEPCLRAKLDSSATDHVTVQLHPDRPFSPHDFGFGHVRYASCGVCGSFALPKAEAALKNADAQIMGSILLTLSEKMAREQRIFLETGGCHAAALFDSKGKLSALFEDVGRHNALDKLIGSMLLHGADNWQTGIVVLSSRASFDIVQKAARAGFSVVAVMGAVSSMAVSVADEHGITLIGFLRDHRLNVYTHPSRIVGI